MVSGTERGPPDGRWALSAHTTVGTGPVTRSGPAAPAAQGSCRPWPVGQPRHASGRQTEQALPDAGTTQGMENRMNFAFSEEQDELRKSVRRFLDDKSPETEVRRLMETADGYDAAVWTQMAEQLGLQSLIIPEQFGGAGFSYVELIVILEEMGAALLCAPFFSTVALAANALLTSGDQSAQEYLLPGIAAEQVGGAQRCLDSSVEYAKTRIQFGRPIGSFQAIKHKCADMLLEVESAKSAAYYAGWAAAEDSDELPVVASLAKSYCSEAYFHAAAETIQIHGGIGFTWEHPAHLYFKRAKSSELMLGDPSYHRELLAQRIGI